MVDDVANETTALGAVRPWLAALDARDVDGVLAASSPVIVLVGPKGDSEGHDALRDWVAGVGFAATTLRWFAGPDTVVAVQLATWVPQDPELAPPRAAVRIAIAFSVIDGLVTRVERFDTVEAALHEAWLGAEDAVAETPA